MRSFQVGGDQFIEALFGRLEYIESLARRHARIVYQQVQTSEFVAGELEQLLPVLTGRHVALENLAARLGPQFFGRVAPPTVGADHRMGGGKPFSDTAANPAAGSCDDGNWSIRHTRDVIIIM